MRNPDQFRLCRWTLVLTNGLDEWIILREERYNDFIKRMRTKMTNHHNNQV